jgi:ubiquinone/menaquinone biosynthesis C-methylase UbiE
MTLLMNPENLSSGPLRCPKTGSSLQLMENGEEILAINTALKSGDLTLAAGSIPEGKIDAVLNSSDGKHQYPVIGGVPCLLDDFRIMPFVKSDSKKKIDLQMSALQREQWKAFSVRYERWTGGPDGVITKVQEEFHRRNATLFSGITNGAVVLDVGNGGATVNEQLGQEIASSVKTFYALDSSYLMLTRNGIREGQILGDATSIPFADKSMDYVIINNTLHHFGRHKDTDPSIKMKEFFNEAFRVSRNGIIGVEMIVPHIAQQIETFVLKFLKFMPTFVYSERFYADLITELGIEVEEFESILQGDMMSPFKFGPPIMDLPFIQLPAFLMPYYFLFYRLKPKAS